MREEYKEFEAAFGRWVGIENVVGCSSGTAALHLALECLGIPQGSKVIVPDFTMVACPRAVTLAGMEPVFVDCGNDLLIDIDALDEACAKEGATGKGVRAIMPVHVYGRQCDMGAIIDLATKYDLCVVEDLAEAHGVSPHPGSDAACWSFYRNKIIAGEEGGAVAFRNAGAADLARELRSLGFTNQHDFRHTPRGHNYRLSNVHARLIRNSLDTVGTTLHFRRQIEAQYDALCPVEWKMPPRLAPWVYDIRIPSLTEEKQSLLVRALKDCCIEARHAFKPMSCQEEYEYCPTYPAIGASSKALIASREVLYLPLTLGTVSGSVAERAFTTIHRALRG